MITKNSEEELNLTGIYSIYCKENNKYYIGSASSTRNPRKDKRGFLARLKRHTIDLRNNKHRNKYLQYSWNKYGEKAFEFSIIEFCSPEECNNKELYYISEYKSMINENGFNIINQSLSNTKEFTSSHKEKISKSLTGKNRPLSLKQTLGHPVFQYTKDWFLIGEFYSITNAAEETNTNRQDINKCLKGITKSANNFRWKKRDKDIV